jgi:hypothetical protein
VPPGVATPPVSPPDDPVRGAAPAVASARAPVVHPLAPEQYKIQFTMSRDTHDKLPARSGRSTATPTAPGRRQSSRWDRADASSRRSSLLLSGRARSARGRRLDAGGLREPGQILLVVLARVPPHDAPERRDSVVRTIDRADPERQTYVPPTSDSSIRCWLVLRWCMAPCDFSNLAGELPVESGPGYRPRRGRSVCPCHWCGVHLGRRIA